MSHSAQQKTLIGKGINLSDPPEKRKLRDIYMDDSNRKGHHFVFGATRIGKTRFVEKIIEQDIEKGFSLLVVDPKGDMELFSKIVQCAYANKRQEELILINPIFPDLSAKIDPMAFYSIAEELINHVVSGIQAKDDFFINVAQSTTSAIVHSLLIFKAHGINSQEPINFEAIFKRCSYAGLASLRRGLEFFHDPYAEETKGALEKILGNPPEFFAKVSTSLQVVLSSLATGIMGRIIGRAKGNDFISRLENNEPAIIVVQTGKLLIGRSAEIAARVIVSMIKSFVGRRFATGKRCAPPLSLVLDEFNSIAFRAITDLFSKGGGAECYITALTQSLSDLDEAIGEPAARKILDNCNAKTFMRVNDPKTAQYISDYSGSKKVFSSIMQFGGGLMAREGEEEMIKVQDIMSQHVRDFYYFGFEGIFKGRSLSVSPPTVKIQYPKLNLTEV